MLQLLPLLTLSVAAPLVAVPDEAPLAGVLELTRQGELILLPEHHAHRFRALLLTHSDEPCRDVEQGMMDVRRYPTRWKQMQNIRVLTETKGRVHYSYELDMMFSPRLEGIVENPAPGRVRYVSDKVKSDFSWALHDAGEGCHMVHTMVQPPGTRSDFVELVQRLEDGTADAAELAAAIAASRGWASPGLKQRSPPSDAALAAWGALAGKGTVIHLVSRPGHSRMLVRAAKRVEASPDRVLRRIRDRQGYAPAGVDFLSSAETEGRETEWNVAYFGGRVSFRTVAGEAGAASKARGRRVTERVVDGDLEEGSWTWTVRQVPGGTMVDLECDLDVTRGSMVLRTLANQDPLIARTNALQLALEFMRVVVAFDQLPVPEVRTAGPPGPPTTTGSDRSEP